MKSILSASANYVGFGLVTLCATAASASNQNWPQWRGPSATGAATEARPPVEWSETKNVRWKVEIPGSGTATPVIWGDQIFIQTAVPTGKKSEPAQAATPPAEPPAGQTPGRRRGGGGGGGGSEKPTAYQQFVLLCLDRATGKTLWKQVAREELPHEGHHKDHGFSSQSPITDGEHIYAYFGSRGLYCYDLKGNLKWQKDLGRMQTKNGFGEGSSPALYQQTIVINWDHEGDDFIAAFDKKTGEERWRQPRSEDTTWATPLIVEHEGKAQVVTDASKKIRSYDLETGKQLWECDGLTANVIPSPVAGHGMVYAMSGFRGSELLAIRLGKSGDLTGTDAIAWTHGKSTPYVPSPLLYGHRLYFFSENSSFLSCFDAKTGEPLINAERVAGLQGVYASPIGADNRVYLVGRTGSTVVIKNSDQLEVLATNKLDDKFDASPAVAGQELYLRGHQYLYCLAEK